MGKNKHKRFAENLAFACLVQPAFDEVWQRDHCLKGRWRADFFGNDNPVALELGCGRGEYTVGLGALYPGRNIIGIDVKGARLWRGAKTATDSGMRNVGFIRTRIEFIESFFAPGEIDEIWITFPDPQLKDERAKKRLTAPGFLDRYARFVRPGGTIHLKTDSLPLHRYTLEVLAGRGIIPEAACEDIYGSGMAGANPELQIKTTYETRFLGEGLPITYLRFRLDNSIPEEA